MNDLPLVYYNVLWLVGFAAREEDLQGNTLCRVPSPSIPRHCPSHIHTKLSSNYRQVNILISRPDSSCSLIREPDRRLGYQLKYDHGPHRLLITNESKCTYIDHPGDTASRIAQQIPAEQPLQACMITQTMQEMSLPAISRKGRTIRLQQFLRHLRQTSMHPRIRTIGMDQTTQTTQ